MKEISMREFQLHASDYLREIPLVLTRNKIPVATIMPYVNRGVNNINATVNTSPETNSLPVNNVIKVQHRCQAPSVVCKGFGIKYRLGFMTDEGVQYKELALCPRHLLKAKSECESVNEL